MAKATHNLSVKIGEYTNAMGETKARWKTIGKVIQMDDGGEFLTLDRTFNPAGVPSDRDTIAVSKFAIEEKMQTPTPATNPVPPVNEMDDIPF